MGKTHLADIPDNYFHLVFTHAGVASNAANAIFASQAFVAPNDIKVKRAWFMPQANNATKGTATTSATYKRVNLLNGGTSGTGTTIIASLNNTASTAAYGSKAFTTTSNNTASGGEILYFSALTVGGTSDDGTALQAAVYEVEYELL